MSALFFPLLALIGAIGVLTLRREMRVLALVLLLVGVVTP